MQSGLEHLYTTKKNFLLRNWCNIYEVEIYIFVVAYSPLVRPEKILCMPLKQLWRSFVISTKTLSESDINEKLIKLKNILRVNSNMFLYVFY